jgi:hypothetical protein
MTNNKEAVARRNAFTGIALVLFTLTLIPYVGEERIKWMMWRDAPLLAAVMVGAAIALIVLSRREPARTSANDR